MTSRIPVIPHPDSPFLHRRAAWAFPASGMSSVQSQGGVLCVLAASLGPLLLSPSSDTACGVQGPTWVLGWPVHRGRLLLLLLPTLGSASLASPMACPRWFRLGQGGGSLLLQEMLCRVLASWKTLCAKSLQSCLTLCHPMECSPSGSSVHGILQARILEWVAISFSRGKAFFKVSVLMTSFCMQGN